MSLPAGVTTCNVIFNTPLSFAGGTGTATLTVRPTQTIIWAATGQPLGAFSDTVTTSAQPGSMALPVVDQPGFVDSAGNTVTNWAYTADVLWTVGTQNLSTHKSFQLLTGQTSVTFDLIPDGNTTIAVTAPTATVTSVNGATGPITLDSASVGLSNVDNTSDANKPLSTAATNALALKQDAASLDTTNAGLVNDSASATAAALNATYVRSAGPATADDTVRLNGLLNAARVAGGGLVRGLAGQNYQISTPLVIGAGVTLDMAGCTVTLIAGSNCNMVNNYAVNNPQRTVTDAAITSGTNTVTSATASFTTADTGRSIVITGAGPNGGMFGLTALLTYVNATTATLTKLDGTAANAGATVSAVSASIYTRDTNITIRGGIWNRGSNGGTGSNQHSLFLRHVDGLVVDLDQFLSNGSGPKYAVQPGDVTEFDLRVRHFNHVSDGIHVRGPAARGYVHDVSGTTNDDFVVFGASDNSRISDGAGDISDIEVRSLFPLNLITNVFKLYGNTGTTISRVRLHGVRGTITKAVSIGATDITGGTFDDITLENLRLSPSAIGVNGSGTTLRIRDVQNIDANPTHVVTLLSVAAGATWSRIHLSDVDMPNAGSTAAGGKIVDINGTVGDLVIEDASMPSLSSGATVQIESGASVTRLFATRCVQAGGSAIVKAPVTATLTEVHYTDCYISGADCLGDFATTTTVLLSNTSAISMTGGFRLRATGNVTVLGSGASRISGGFVTAAGYAVRVNCPDFSCNLSLVTVKSNGDRANNSNAALACGVGPAITNGSSWKNLYSGLTY